MNELPAEWRYSAMRWNAPLSEEHADELLEHLDLADARRIVDLGCGWGELLLRAAARSGATAVGVDSDPTLLDLARRAAKARGLGVTFVEQRAEDWGGVADRALCIGSSHTLGGSRPMLARLAKIAPRGRVLVGDACWESPPTPGVTQLAECLLHKRNVCPSSYPPCASLRPAPADLHARISSLPEEYGALDRPFVPCRFPLAPQFSCTQDASRRSS